MPMDNGPDSLMAAVAQLLSRYRKAFVSGESLKTGAGNDIEAPLSHDEDLESRARPLKQDQLVLSEDPVSPFVDLTHST